MAKRRSTKVKVVERVVVGVAAKRKSKRRRTRKSKKSRMAGVCESGAKYAKCVLDPHSNIAAKVPDGSCDSVVMEYDISVAAVPSAQGTMAVLMVPGLPCSLYALDGSFTMPDRDGNVTSGNLITQGGAMVPFSDFNSGVNSAIAGSIVNYNTPRIWQARAVAYKLEVIPTGPILSQGGAAVAARVPIRAQFTWPEKDAGTTFNSKTYAGASAHAVVAKNGVRVNFQALQAYPDSRITTGTESSVLIGIPPDYEFTPVHPLNADQTNGPNNLVLDSYPGLTVIASNTSGSGASGGQFVNADMNNVFAMLPSDVADIALFGNFWEAPESMGLAWCGQSLPSGQGYTIRARICMELCVDHVTSLYRPFITPPAEDQPQVISAVRNVVKALPPAIPKEESSPGWWARLTGVSSGISDIVSMLGIPVLSPMAGLVGKFTKMLM